MNILILGGGGREHALAWAIRQNPKCDRLIVAPGNAGIAAIARCADLDIVSRGDVLAFAEEHAIDFVVIGPEAPLAAGIADALREAGFLVFGPSQAAARLESSKAFTKEICDASGAPTAAWARFGNAAAARNDVTRRGAPIVVKADGLAAGKGVTVAETVDQAHSAIDAIFDGEFGDTSVVIEDFMEGEEASFFVLCDGRDCLAMGTAQDHKRVGEGDTGPNTGGMGAYSPACVLTPALEAQAMREIVEPTVATLAEDGTPFIGVLYAGLMLTAQGPKLIEYNARFGDPECQVLMARFDGDLAQLLLATSEGRLSDIGEARFIDDTAMVVVMAARGYPGTPEAGGTIEGIEAAEATGATVFHAGTRMAGDVLSASGGRVLGVTATGANIAAAKTAAYRAVGAINFPTGFYRRDIGWRELER